MLHIASLKRFRVKRYERQRLFNVCSINTQQDKQHQQGHVVGFWSSSAAATSKTPDEERAESGSSASTSGLGRSKSSPGSSSTEQQHLTDLRHPALWYPAARALRRTIIAHLGPTNSGKTHSALAALKAANKGVYCGPLRLLACEIADRLNAEGVPCTLTTGQECREAEGARHTSCTVEMASVADDGGNTHIYDVAVVDEIQMISNPGRGWSWTRALLGLPARELHVCGDPAALPVLQKLAEECGDELQVRTYQRLSPLVVMAEPLAHVSQVQAGDCLVAFSRRAVHGLKREVLRRSDQRCCLVYGALPPEARRQQAALFNSSAAAADRDGAGAGAGAGASATGSSSSTSSSNSSEGAAASGNGSGDASSSSSSSSNSSSDNIGSDQRTGAADAGEAGSGRQSDSSSSPGGMVLVASDAIGMGLNLNIRRVVFTSLKKFDGTRLRQLADSEIKQIAGRAGRFGTAHSTGYVTCLDGDDLPALHAALAAPPVSLEQACLLPRFDDLALFSSHHPGLPFHEVISQFCRRARLSQHYLLGEVDNMKRIAHLLAHVGSSLSMEEIYTFCVSPTDVDDRMVAAALLRFVALYVGDGLVPLRDSVLHPPLQAPQTEAELKRLEELHRVYDLYVWLAMRMPTQFCDLEEANKQRQELSRLVTQGLETLSMFHTNQHRDYAVPGSSRRGKRGSGGAWAGSGSTNKGRGGRGSGGGHSDQASDDQGPGGEYDDEDLWGRQEERGHKGQRQGQHHHAARSRR